MFFLMLLSAVSAINLGHLVSSLTQNDSIQYQFNKDINKTNALMELVNQAKLDPDKTNAIVAMIQELIEHTRKDYDLIDGRLVDAEKAVTDATTDRDQKKETLLSETDRLKAELEAANQHLSAMIGARDTEKADGEIQTNGVNLQIAMLQRVITMLNNMKAWTSCPNGWAHQGRSCYLHGGRQNNHIDARAECQSQGADLIRWDSADDHGILDSWCDGGCTLGLTLCHQDQTQLCYEDDTIFNLAEVPVRGIGLEWMNEWDRSYAGYHASSIYILRPNHDNWFTVCEKQLEANT